MSTGLIGTPVSRVDGRPKVTGRAPYAAEAALPNMTHAVLVCSTVASGTISRIDTSLAEKAPGVLLVLTHENRGPLGKMPSGAQFDGWPSEPRPPLEDARVHYFGQLVAMVVAGTLEEAAHAARLVKVEYAPAPFVVTLDDPRATRFRPQQVLGERLQETRGGMEGALVSAAVRGRGLEARHGEECGGTLAAAEVTVDATYTSPNEHPCAMEPHASIASWSGDTLTVHNSSQWVMGDRTVLRAALDLPEDRVRILSPFVGGMFGSKATTAGHTILAAIASMRLGRPVKVVLTRPQVLTTIGHRTETVQRFELGASRDGTLVAMRHSTLTHVQVESGFPDDNVWVEPTSFTSRMLYACPNYESIHEAARLNVMKPSWMRAPGEAPCMWALESVMDELACALDMDPVELRRRNHAVVNPSTGKPFSSKHLLACYEQGAQRFGWPRRSAKPGSMRDGEVQVGWGMATATYPGWLMGATARVRLLLDDSGVRAVVSTAGSDVGQGAYTMMTLVAAEGLGLPMQRVRAELGDSNLTPCAVAGASNLTASIAPAVMEACLKLRKQLLGLASALPDGFPDAAERADDFVFSDGRLRPRTNSSEGFTYEELVARSGLSELEAEGKTEPIITQNDQYAFQSFGAHFVEVRVLRDIGQVRVSRVVSVFDVGRVMNAKAVRSQFIGGIVFGIGAALLEGLVYDRVRGQPINADLAGYLVPVCADVPDIDVSWIGEPDLNFNAMGCRGAGEIGITGMAAAIANAVYHATGVRVRELPIAPESLL
ncbi:MAG: xanthine dehydrogenase family protein molybdopterin-binding subunit [Myxococcaceae bacterium]|nr:xanthine dehydrogenase family protein molybdopterin-binding subunit [Myxococcaceae bacterium]